MKIKELIKEVSNAYLLVNGNSEKSKEIKNEIIEKLRQLEDYKRLIKDVLHNDALDELFVMTFFGKEEEEDEGE